MQPCILSFLGDFCARPQVPIIVANWAFRCICRGWHQTASDHTLVGIGEWHGMAQEGGLLLELLS